MITNVLVTGASGRVGGLVVRQLLQQGLRPRVLTRNPENFSTQFAADPAAHAALDVRAGDFSDPASLRLALADVEAAFLVSPAHPDQRTLQSQFATVAAATSRPHIVKLSGLGTKLDSFVDSGRWHAETEQDIEQLGLSYTFLRPHFFMQNLIPQLRAAAAEGVLRSATPDAPIAMVDVQDLAAVIVAALLGTTKASWCANTALVPTGPVALSYRELAAQFADVLGRSIELVEQSPAEQVAALERAGLPEWRRNNLAQFSRAFAAGWGAPVTDVVAQATGRQPTSVAELLAAAAL